MRFMVQKTCSEGARLGKLVLRNKDYETPFCTVYTRMGSAPYLTADVLKRIENLPGILHIPFNWLAEHVETIEAFPGDLADFCGLKGSSVYCSLHDPLQQLPAGHNDSSSVAVWSVGGKRKLTTELHRRLVRACRPALVQGLCDADTPRGHTEKRARKSVERTLSWMETPTEVAQVTKSESTSQSPKAEDSAPENAADTVFLASFVGGFSRRERGRCVREMQQRAVEGVVLDGFHNRQTQSSLTDFELDSLRDLGTSLLPPSTLRFLHGGWRPDQVLSAISAGVDVFDSSYAYTVTERSSALIFSFQLGEEVQPQLELDLRDARLARDTRNILSSCTCYTCRTHSRSYLQHLVNTRELLAPVLLMIHNFHHYFAFFAAIREAIREDRLEKLIDHIRKQIPADSDTVLSEALVEKEELALKAVQTAEEAASLNQES